MTKPQGPKNVQGRMTNISLGVRAWGLGLGHSLVIGIWALGILLQLPDDRGQRLPFDILHGVEVHAALAADAEDRHDVGMVEVGRRLGFVLETLQMLGIQRRRKRQHLERYPTAK